MCYGPVKYILLSPHTLQCGILLGGLLLFVSATLTVWSCKMVLKAAHTKSKHSFESLGECMSYGLFHGLCSTCLITELILSSFGSLFSNSASSVWQCWETEC